MPRRGGPRQTAGGRKARRSLALAATLVGLGGVPLLFPAAAGEPRETDHLHPGTAAATADGALAPATVEGPWPVRDLRVTVKAEGPDTVSIRLSWEPADQGPPPARYRVYLARVHRPHRIVIGERDATTTEAAFRVPRHPADLNCCPVVRGRAVYMEGPDAGAWGDTFPEGPYRQLLTAGVVALGPDDTAGVLTTLQFDPEAVLAEAQVAVRPPAPGAGPDTAPAEEREPTPAEEARQDTVRTAPGPDTLAPAPGQEREERQEREATEGYGWFPYLIVGLAALALVALLLIRSSRLDGGR